MAEPYKVADLFCGMGGTSEGVYRAAARIGRSLELVAVNHWPRAIESHQANHPDARHYCTGVDLVDPRELVPGGRLDLLVASPECTHHSNARGGRPMSDQSRTSADSVILWASRLEVDEILVENVPEFRGWGPLGADGRPVARLKGALFQSWLNTLRALGYETDHRVLNCADFGDPTTRGRLFVRASRRGPVVWPEPTHGDPKAIRGDLFESAVLPWRTAREIIDWSLEGTSIFGRKRPLAEKTLRRTFAGLARYSGAAALPHLVALRSYMASLGYEPPEIPAHLADLALSAAVLRYNGVAGESSVGDPLGTVTTKDRFAFAEPCLLPHPRSSEPLTTDSVDDPLRTLTATSCEMMIAEPAIVMLRNGSEGASLDRPVPTLCAGANHVGLAEPFLSAYHNGEGGERRTQDLGSPIGTLDCSNRYALAEPLVVTINHGNTAGADGDTHRSQSVDAPLTTVTTSRGKAVVEPFVLPHRQFDRMDADSVDEPMRTITALNGRQNHLAEPTIIPIDNASSGDVASGIGDPLTTVTAKARHAVADPVLIPNFGERDGQGPRSHPVDAPLPAVTSHGAGMLVTLHTGEEFLVDVRLRMLRPHELAAAMGMEGYAVSGNLEDQVRQIGNAVPANTAAALAASIMAANP